MICYVNFDYKKITFNGVFNLFQLKNFQIKCNLKFRKFFDCIRIEKNWMKH